MINWIKIKHQQWKIPDKCNTDSVSGFQGIRNCMGPRIAGKITWSVSRMKGFLFNARLKVSTETPSIRERINVYIWASNNSRTCALFIIDIALLEISLFNYRGEKNYKYHGHASVVLFLSPIDDIISSITILPAWFDSKIRSLPFISCLTYNRS